MFKRGYVLDGSIFWDWYKEIADGKNTRRNGSILLKNEAHVTVMTWHFRDAWINKIEYPTFKASGNEVAIESMELIHEGLVLEPISSATS